MFLLSPTRDSYKTQTDKKKKRKWKQRLSEGMTHALGMEETEVNI